MKASENNNLFNPDTQNRRSYYFIKRWVLHFYMATDKAFSNASGTLIGRNHSDE